MQLGIISKVYNRFYNLISENDFNITLQGKMRGHLKLLKKSEAFRKQRHLISIGDYVNFKYINEIDSKEKNKISEVLIVDVLKRKNSLERANNHEIQCLGANIDRALILISLSSPQPNFGFLDRFLCAAHAGKIEPFIVFTKKDLYEKKLKQGNKKHPIKLYQKLGYNVFTLNLKEKKEIKKLQKKIKTGRSLLVGQSGVGKSTLLNLLLDKNVQKTGHVSLSTKYGRHITTNASLFFSKSGASYIDSPGIREWGLNHVSYINVLSAFPETAKLMQKCSFANCQHNSYNSGCAIINFLDCSRKFINQKNKNIDKYPKNILLPSRLHSLDTIISSLIPKNKNKIIKK